MALFLPKLRVDHDDLGSCSVASLRSTSSSAFPVVMEKQRQGKPSSEALLEYNTIHVVRHRQSSSGTRYGYYDGAADAKPQISAATLPRIRVPSLFRRRPRPSLNTVDSSSSQKSGSLKYPDRFVPTRRPTLDSVVESFRVNKDPVTLSPEERLLRHKDATADAFSARRRVTSPSPRLNRAAPPLPRRNFSRIRSGGSGGASVLTFHREPPSANGERQVSVGTVWTVGGLAPFSTGVPNGRGGFIGSGTNAPMYTTPFSIARSKAQEELENHERRLAEALDIDRSARVLDFRDPSISPLRSLGNDNNRSIEAEGKTTWSGTEWVLPSPDQSAFRYPPMLRSLADCMQRPRSPKSFGYFRCNLSSELPSCLEEQVLISCRVLDAPNLRDDFYCSILAYSSTCHTLAVGLGALLYAWSEKAGVRLISSGSQNGSWLTSLAFSSTEGGRSILAFGKSDGSLSLMSLTDGMISVNDGMIPRHQLQQPSPIACITWKPATTMRLSQCPVTPGLMVRTEDLVVGDELGSIYYYSVEWPEAWEVTRNGWSGSTTLLARISIHTQQICGLSFNPDGSMFGSGGNDNLCCLYETREVLEPELGNYQVTEEVFVGADGVRQVRPVRSRNSVKELRRGAEKHRWIHGAAVKAIAFCPWREGLVATSGGSNDKCIHFFHTSSGACLATISVAAQVTSLIWSTTRREIVATFGYAQPDHPYRIAIFSWPSCKQEGEHRALYAIAYPGGPNESSTSREGGRGLSRTAKEGCIVVACSDESVKFHEVWTAGQKATIGGEGLLGGSDILEGLEGIDKEGEVIR
ncbi:putative WD repeat-containing protein [Lachnellula suecica]|uniref:Putative WD repeat-containing protein n=1 Tax=Lachnellula suecica TaxID=602035 RepID=A0A8T9CDC1_9HELO|nr:putative WD repeat-containing protein [Lachnellula suecica]